MSGVSSVVVAVVLMVLLAAGAAVGMGTAFVVYRRRFSRGWLPVRSAALGGLTFLAVYVACGHAGDHAQFIGGHRADIGSRGESLWLRNRVADNTFVICVAVSALAGLLAGSHFPRRFTGASTPAKEERP